MPTIDIPTKVMKEFETFCSCNGIEDVEKEFLAVFTLGFNVRKYGVTPFKSLEPLKTKDTIAQPNITNKKNNTQEKQQEEKPKKRVKIIKIKENGIN